LCKIPGTNVECLAAWNDDLAVPLDDLANIGTMPHEELPYERQARDGPLELRAHLALVGRARRRR
jgi:hypothetical protein